MNTYNYLKNIMKSLSNLHFNAKQTNNITKQEVLNKIKQLIDEFENDSGEKIK